MRLKLSTSRRRPTPTRGRYSASERRTEQRGSSTIPRLLAGTGLLLAPGSAASARRSNALPSGQPRRPRVRIWPDNPLHLDSQEVAGAILARTGMEAKELGLTGNALMTQPEPKEVGNQR